MELILLKIVTMINITTAIKIIIPKIIIQVGVGLDFSPPCHEHVPWPLEELMAYVRLALLEADSGFSANTN